MRVERAEGDEFIVTATAEELNMLQRAIHDNPYAEVQAMWYEIFRALASPKRPPEG